MKEHFVILDRNKNGYLSQGDWTLWVDNLKKVIKMTPEEEATLRDCHVRLAAKLGATDPGVQVSEEEYLKNAAAFAASNDTAFLAEINKAWYHVLDINDDGAISLDEYIKVMEACNMNAETAKTIFQFADKNNDGRIQIREMEALGEKFWNSFWFSTEPPAVEGGYQPANGTAA